MGVSGLCFVCNSRFVRHKAQKKIRPSFRTALAISGDKHPRPGARIIDCGTRTVTAQVRLDNLRPIGQPPNSRKAVRPWDDGAGDLAAYAVGDITQAIELMDRVAPTLRAQGRRCFTARAWHVCRSRSRRKGNTLAGT